MSHREMQHTNRTEASYSLNSGLFRKSYWVSSEVDGFKKLEYHHFSSFLYHRIKLINSLVSGKFNPSFDCSHAYGLFLYDQTS
ncbi:hypothetical protein ACQ4LE_009926 [Meloidogyne hapla]